MNLMQIEHKMGSFSHCKEMRHNLYDTAAANQFSHKTTWNWLYSYDLIKDFWLLVCFLRAHQRRTFLKLESRRREGRAQGCLSRTTQKVTNKSEIIQTEQNGKGFTPTQACQEGTHLKWTSVHHSLWLYTRVTHADTGFSV